MAEHLDYTTPKRKKVVIEFKLDGDDYHFTPPKNADMVLPVLKEKVTDAGLASIRAQFNWINDGLPKVESARLLKKLQDPGDDFDWPDLEKISDWVMKQVNKGRPTG